MVGESVRQGSLKMLPTGKLLLNFFPAHGACVIDIDVEKLMLRQWTIRIVVNIVIKLVTHNLILNVRSKHQVHSIQDCHTRIHTLAD